MDTTQLDGNATQSSELAGERTTARERVERWAGTIMDEVLAVPPAETAVPVTADMAEIGLALEHWRETMYDRAYEAVLAELSNRESRSR